MYCTPEYIRALNGPHMRILRRIAGDPNFGEAKFSDVRIREQLSRPSQARSRLSYSSATTRGPLIGLGSSRTT
eukprot:5522655-Pyramimonas_sp.AAC.1